MRMSNEFYFSTSLHTFYFLKILLKPSGNENDTSAAAVVMVVRQR